MTDMSNYKRARGTRYDGRNQTGTFRGGELNPVMAVPFEGNESGVVTQSVVFELDPIAGRMLTEINADIVSVFVPALACEAMQSENEEFAGSAEAYRAKMLSGAAVFGVETESEVTMRMGIVPRKVAGVQYVGKIGRLAHNVAVNFLRRRKHVNAAQIDRNNTHHTPALIGQSILERFNGVLDPEDRINGTLNLDLPNMQLPIRGLAIQADAGTPAGTGWLKGVDGEVIPEAEAQASYKGTNANVFVKTKRPAETTWPEIHAEMDGMETGNVSLSDFYTAERMDSLTRQMRKIVDDNPTFGEQQVLNWAHGLTVDVGKQPFVVYEQTRVFNMGMKHGMDGPNLDVTQSNLSTVLEFTVPIPPSEFGGILVTFVSIRPDETLAAQPHPILSREWGARNFVADELAIDPVPVMVRDINADCETEDEENVSFYVGNNHMLKNYSNYGFNRLLDQETVAAKTAIWQIEIPTSVTARSVIYPNWIDHYPFVDQVGDICTYTVNTMAQIKTPIIMGPSPVEELVAIETEDIFEDQ